MKKLFKILLLILVFIIQNISNVLALTDEIKNDYIVLFIIILIWAIFLILSFIFGGNWFLIMTGILGIGMAFFYDFTGKEILQFIFIAFNIMIMAYAVLYHNNGLLTK